VDTQDLLLCQKAGLAAHSSMGRRSTRSIRLESGHPQKTRCSQDRTQESRLAHARAVVAGVTRTSQVPKGNADIQSPPQGDLSRQAARFCFLALMARADRQKCPGTRRKALTTGLFVRKYAIGSALATRQPLTGHGALVMAPLVRPLVGRNQWVSGASSERSTGATA
jgi:hypothetical protein